MTHRWRALIICFALLTFAIASTNATAEPPAHQFVYVANSGSNDVSAYRVNAAGVLVPVPGSPFPAGRLPEGVTIDPTGRFLYVASSGEGISAYKIDPSTGTLTSIKGAPFAAGRSSVSIAIDRTDTFAYVNNINSGSVSVYRIGSESGVLTPVPGSPFSIGETPYFLALNPHLPVVYVVTESSIETFTTTGGRLTRIAQLAKPQWSANDLAIDYRAKFAYSTNEHTRSISIYALNGASGSLKPLPGPAVRAGLGPSTIRIDPNGAFLYVGNVSFPRSSISVYSINGHTGALASIQGSPFGPVGVQGLAITPDRNFLYATNFYSKGTISGYAINPKTGALKPVIGTPFAAGSRPWGIATCRVVDNRCKP
ncbi:MAG TPA: beta-propeller fold lactonase family protein [Candidatus Tumulicola sp.]|jgi:6-phosphogluconolactonase (cycloisomerase 2 family)